MRFRLGGVKGPGPGLGFLSAVGHGSVQAGPSRERPDRAMGTTSQKEESDREEAGGRPTPPTLAMHSASAPAPDGIELR